VVEHAGGPALTRTSEAERVTRRAVQENIRAGRSKTSGKVAQALLALATLHERELSTDREGPATIRRELRHRGQRRAILDRQRTRVRLSIHHAANEVFRRDLPHP